MTKSKILLDNNLHDADKESVELEKLFVEGPRDDSCTREKQTEDQLSANNEQVLKKTVSKSQTTKKNKKLNSDKRKQETEKLEHKTNVSGNKSLEECKNRDILPTNKTPVKKENKTKKIDKCKIISPNHKLTEYFSDLRVDEPVKGDVSEQTNLKEKPERKLRQRKVKCNIKLTNHKVTEYFHIRRSERKYKKNISDEKQNDLENKIINGVEDGLKIKEFEGKGRGIITTKQFHKGDFVVEYIGDLIDRTTAKQREIGYAKNKNIGCYMYYFKHKDRQYCIDATEESGKLGRLINHSRKGNLLSRIIEVNQTPHLVLFAKVDIPIDTEVLYDYGDRSRDSVLNHPWLTL